MSATAFQRMRREKAAKEAEAAKTKSDNSNGGTDVEKQAIIDQIKKLGGKANKRMKLDTLTKRLAELTVNGKTDSEEE